MGTQEPRLLRLIAHRMLYPELDRHASWLPADWPARHRPATGLGPAGCAALAELLRREAPAQVLTFDSRLSRLALVDGTSLRLLAAYVGLCAHRPWLLQRGQERSVHRPARGLATDALDFVVNRAPPLSALPMNLAPLQQRPHGAARCILDRGMRLLLAALAGEDEAVVQRVRRKLPRRVAAQALPALAPAQAAQLHELVLQCLLPERLPAWDWLF